MRSGPYNTYFRLSLTFFASFDAELTLLLGFTWRIGWVSASAGYFNFTSDSAAPCYPHIGHRFVRILPHIVIRVGYHDSLSS